MNTNSDQPSPELDEIVKRAASDIADSEGWPDSISIIRRACLDYADVVVLAREQHHADRERDLQSEIATLLQDFGEAIAEGRLRQETIDSLRTQLDEAQSEIETLRLDRDNALALADKCQARQAIHAAMK
jgi:hypothetical protein